MDLSKDKIIDLISDLETEHKIEILYAVEVGSRAYGYATDNSDFDVRFIFRRPVNEYLNVDTPADVITKQDKNIDIVGYDIKKTLGLLKKSNPTIYEMLHSPIVYKNSDTATVITKYAKNYFHKSYLLSHYTQWAAGMLSKFDTKSEIPVKKAIHILRCILMADAIYHSSADDIDVSINLQDVCSNIKHDLNLIAWLETMIDIRSKCGNDTPITFNNLKILCHNHIDRNDKAIKAMDADWDWNDIDCTELNTLCHNIINRKESIYFYAI